LLKVLVIQAFKIYASFAPITATFPKPTEMLKNRHLAGQTPSKSLPCIGPANGGFVNIKITAMTFGYGQNEPGKSPFIPLYQRGNPEMSPPLLKRGDRGDFQRMHSESVSQVQPSCAAESKPMFETRWVTETVIRNETNRGFRGGR